MKYEERIIKTNLKGDVAYEVLEAVIGQLSDGIWENSENQQLQQRWRLATIMMDGEEVVIKVVKDYYTINRWTHNWIKNPYAQESDQQIRNYFARKIKTIIGIEKKDKGSRWDGRSTYLGYKEDPTEEQCDQICKTLRGYKM